PVRRTGDQAAGGYADREFGAASHRYVHRVAINRIDPRNPLVKTVDQSPEFDARIFGQGIKTSRFAAFVFRAAEAPADFFQTVERVQTHQCAETFPFQNTRVELTLVAVDAEIHRQVVGAFQRCNVFLRRVTFENQRADGLFAGQALVGIKVGGN